MYNVQILMSTFNGEDRLIRQVESIMNQRNVNISLLIRDDGSNDNTVVEIRSMQEKYPNKIHLVNGKNCGWKLSFRKLIYLSGDFDFYCFADQDDFWLQDKIITCIETLENNSKACPKLVHCNSISVDERMSKRGECENRIPLPKSHKMALATEIFQGCGMLWNNEAMRVLKRYVPENITLAHDYWVGLICYFFGEIYFIETPLFYHIRYGNSTSADGNRNKGRVRRICNIINTNKSAYMNPSFDLIKGYSDLLSNEDKQFLIDLIEYKKNMKAKMNLLRDKDFIRPTRASTFVFKMSILFNRF